MKAPEIRHVGLALACSYPIIRRGLAEAVADEDGLVVRAELGTRAELIDALGDPHVNVVVLSLDLDGGVGLDTVREVRERRRDVRLLVLSRRDERLYADRALKAGAHGYLMKTAPVHEIVAGIRQVAEGGVVLSGAMTQQVLRRATEGAPSASPIEELTPRELEVFESLGRGRTTREIAAELGVSIKTVETYRARIKDKLGLENANRLLRRAVSWVESGQ